VSTLLSAIASLTIAAYALPAWAEKPLKARAIVRGFPGSGIEGVVTFVQRKGDFPEPAVDIDAKISGPIDTLAPGRHGMHIHEFGVCDPNTTPRYITSGGHYDPGPNSNSNPDANHPFHMGDIPNLVVNEMGEGSLKATTSRITLSAGPLSVFDADNPATPVNEAGSVVLIHLNPDQGQPGAPGSGVSGGPRIACGIIDRVAEDDED
jgi:Cu-Zn family superoxide dismutase